MPCRISLPRAAPRAREARLSIPQALLLGALHGPAEFLPISSSGHVTAIPWLLGWRYSELDDDLRKSFEVALHAGSAAGWLVLSGGGRSLIGWALNNRRQATLVGLTTAPAALAGLTLERPIQRRLGTPRSVGTGLLAGAAAMLVADRAPRDRPVDDVRSADALWLGIAQACALFPGVSRTAATLSAARLRGFSGSAAWRLSARAATPVIAGATALKLVRMAERPPGRAQAAGLAAGAGASFGSSLLAARALRPLDRAWPLWPFAAYRSALGMALVLGRRPRNSPARPCRNGCAVTSTRDKGLAGSV